MEFKKNSSIDHKLCYSKKKFESFKMYIKLYISKALDIKLSENDTVFIKSIDKSRLNRTNITPNGAVVPKREFHLEYNLILRSWTQLVKQITHNNSKLLKLFRITPNVRIKFGKELSDDKISAKSPELDHIFLK